MTEKYPLQDLLHVRRFREDAAAKEFTRSREAVAEAKDLVSQRKKELEEYVAWRIRREESLYQEIMKQPVQLKTLDDLKLEVQLLREKEFLYVQKIHDAEESLKQAEAALEKAHAAHQAAHKNVEKIEEHRELWAQDAAKRVEESEEKELEDFRVRAHESDQSNQDHSDV